MQELYTIITRSTRINLKVDLAKIHFALALVSFLIMYVESYFDNKRNTEFFGVWFLSAVLIMYTMGSTFFHILSIISFVILTIAFNKIYCTTALESLWGICFFLNIIAMLIHYTGARYIAHLQYSVYTAYIPETQPTFTSSVSALYAAIASPAA